MEYLRKYRPIIDRLLIQKNSKSLQLRQDFNIKQLHQGIQKLEDKSKDLISWLISQQ